MPSQQSSFSENVLPRQLFVPQVKVPKQSPSLSQSPSPASHWCDSVQQSLPPLQGSPKIK